MNQPESATRYHGLDALRAFAMFLGVVLHAQMPFVEGFWPIQDPHVSMPKFWQGLFLFIHSFRMPLFFILSGFFTCMLLNRKGSYELIKNRSKRILLPFFIACFTILPLTFIAFLTSFSLQSDVYDLNKLVQALQEWHHDSRANQFSHTTHLFLHLGHLWFLWLLILFTPFFILLHQCYQLNSKLINHNLKVFKLCFLFILVLINLNSLHQMLLPVGPDTPLIPSVPFYMLAYYFSFFCMGALFYRHEQKSNYFAYFEKFSFIMCAFGSVIMIYLIVKTIDSDYLNSRTWGMTILEGVGAYGLCFGLIGMAMKVLHKPSGRLRFLSDSSYWVYLIHIPLVFFSQGLFNSLEFPAVLKLGLYLLFVLSIALVSYRYLIRYTLVGTILNGKKSV